MRAAFARSALAFAVFGVFWGSWASLVPEVKAETGVSDGQLGVALLGIAVGALPAMLLAGVLIDRARRPLVPEMLVFFAAVAVLPAFAGSWWQLAAAMVAVGAGSGALDVSVNAAVSGAEVRTGRRVMQGVHALYSAGLLVASVVVGIARDAGAGRVAVLVVVSASLLATAALNRRETVEHVTVAAPTPRLRVTRALLALGLLGGLVFFLEGGIEGWSALFVERELDSQPSVSGFAPGLFAGAMAAGRAGGQALTARLGDRLLVIVGALVAATGLALAAPAPSAPVALVGFALAGAGVSVIAPTVYGAAGRGAPSPIERGSSVATVTTLAYVGFLVAPPMIGGVAGGTSLRVAFALMAGIALALAAAGAATLPARSRHASATSSPPAGG